MSEGKVNVWGTCPDLVCTTSSCFTPGLGYHRALPSFGRV